MRIGDVLIGDDYTDEVFVGEGDVGDFIVVDLHYVLKIESVLVAFD